MFCYYRVVAVVDLYLVLIVVLPRVLIHCCRRVVTVLVLDCVIFMIYIGDVASGVVVMSSYIEMLRNTIYV